MDKNLNRYGSYSKFPPDVEMYPLHLANAGFYYKGNEDEVVCFSCGVKYKGWKKDDNPMYIHRMLSPHCRFLIESEMNTNANQAKESTDPENGNKASRNKRNDTNLNTREQTGDVGEMGACGGASNISNGISTHCKAQSTNRVTQTTVGESVLSSTKNEQIVKEVQETNQMSHEKRPIGGKTKSEYKNSMDPLGISFERPVYPQYAITTVRLSSFREWPKQMKQKPQDLAKAGFFHEGVADKVRCFFCGGGLINWDPEDDPWIEHARWYPRCVYLRQSKGDEFIFRVQSGLAKPEEKPKTIDPLSHPAFLSVIEMGCKPDVVRQAWDSLSEKNGQENISAEKLLLKVWKLEEECKDNHSTNTEEIKTRDSNNDNNESETEKKTVSENSLKELSNQLNTDDRLAIAEENRQLKEQQTCKICLDEDIAIVFLPCGHMAACASCAPALRKCPICRTFIKGTVRAILS